MQSESRGPSGTQRILVVEDDRLLATQLNELFAIGGYEVEVVGTAREAVTGFMRAPADLVLVDAVLPDSHGLQVVQQLRELPGGSVPILMMSAIYQNPEALRRDMKRLGVLEFIAKPFRVFDLAGRVQGLLAGGPVPAHHASQGIGWTLDDDSAGGLARDGDVDRDGLLALLLGAFQRRLSGRLDVRHGQTERCFYLLNGYFAWYQSNVPNEELGSTLLRAMLVDEGELDRARERASRVRGGLPQVLLEQQLIQEEALAQHIQQELARGLGEALSWTEASYQLELGAEFADQLPLVECNPVRVMWDAVRMSLTMDQISAALGAPATRLVKAPGFGLLYPYLSLRGRLAQLSSVLGENLTLDGIYTAIPDRSGDLMRALWLLRRLGCLIEEGARPPQPVVPEQPVVLPGMEHQPPPGAAATPVEELEPVTTAGSGTFDGIDLSGEGPALQPSAAQQAFQSEADRASKAAGRPARPARPRRPRPSVKLSKQQLVQVSQTVQRDHRNYQRTDYYALLGKPQDASAAELAQAIRMLARGYRVAYDSPEIDDGVRRQARDLLAHLKQVRKTLGDAGERARYDQGLKSRPVRGRATNERTRSPVELADDCIRDKRWNRAWNLLQRMRDQDGSNPDILARLGWVRHHLPGHAARDDEEENAIGWLKLAITFDARHFEANRYLAQIQVEQGNWSEAARPLKVVLGQKPSDSWAQEAFRKAQARAGSSDTTAQQKPRRSGWGFFKKR